jgi:hypothetical protein
VLELVAVIELHYGDLHLSTTAPEVVARALGRLRWVLDGAAPVPLVAAVRRLR